MFRVVLILLMITNYVLCMEDMNFNSQNSHVQKESVVRQTTHHQDHKTPDVQVQSVIRQTTHQAPRRHHVSIAMSKMPVNISDIALANRNQQSSLWLSKEFGNVVSRVEFDKLQGEYNASKDEILLLKRFLFVVGVFTFISFIMSAVAVSRH